MRLLAPVHHGSHISGINGALLTRTARGVVGDDSIAHARVR